MKLKAQDRELLSQNLNSENNETGQSGRSDELKEAGKDPLESSSKKHEPFHGMKASKRRVTTDQIDSRASQPHESGPGAAKHGKGLTARRDDSAAVVSASAENTVPDAGPECPRPTLHLMGLGRTMESHGRDPTHSHVDSHPSRPSKALVGAKMGSLPATGSVALMLAPGLHPARDLEPLKSASGAGAQAGIDQAEYSFTST